MQFDYPSNALDKHTHIHRAAVNPLPRPSQPPRPPRRLISLSAPRRSARPRTCTRGCTCTSLGGPWAAAAACTWLTICRARRRRVASCSSGAEKMPPPRPRARMARVRAPRRAASWPDAGVGARSWLRAAPLPPLPGLNVSTLPPPPRTPLQLPARGAPASARRLPRAAAEAPPRSTGVPPRATAPPPRADRRGRRAAIRSTSSPRPAPF